MQLTMTGEYAIRAMIHLSSLPYGTVVHIADVSKEWDIPENFLRKITAQLVAAGLVRTVRGLRGGITLARPAEQSTLLDVIEAAEGKILLNKCLLCSSVCPRDAWCQVHQVWNEAQEALVKILSRKSLAQLAAENLDCRAALEDVTSVAPRVAESPSR